VPGSSWALLVREAKQKLPSYRQWTTLPKANEKHPEEHAFRLDSMPVAQFSRNAAALRSRSLEPQCARPAARVTCSRARRKTKTMSSGRCSAATPRAKGLGGPAEVDRPKPRRTEGAKHESRSTFEFGSLPRYEDFSGPTAEAGDVLIHVKAAVLENFDKMAARVHYAGRRMFLQFPAIVGHSGVGALTDGTSPHYANFWS